MLSESQKTIKEKIIAGEKLSTDEFRTYKGTLDSFAKVNKLFDKIYNNVLRSNVLSKEDLQAMEKVNRFLNFKSMPAISVVKRK